MKTRQVSFALGDVIPRHEPLRNWPSQCFRRPRWYPLRPQCRADARLRMSQEESSEEPQIHLTNSPEPEDAESPQFASRNATPNGRQRGPRRARTTPFDHETTPEQRAVPARRSVGRSSGDRRAQLDAKLRQLQAQGREGPVSEQWFREARKVVASPAYNVTHAVRLIYQLWRMQKTSKPNAESIANFFGTTNFLSKWAEPVSDGLPRLSGKELVVMLQSLVRLDQPPNAIFLSKWLPAITPKLRDLSRGDLIQAIDGISRIGPPPPTIPEDFMNTWTVLARSKCLVDDDYLVTSEEDNHSESKFSADQLVVLLRALDALGVDPYPATAEFFDGWVRTVAPLLGEAHPSALVFLMSSLTKRKVPMPSEFMELWSNAVGDSIKGFNVSELLTMMKEQEDSGTALSQKLKEKWMDAASDLIARMKCSSAELLSIMESLLDAGVEPSASLVGTWLAATERSLSTMNAYGVASVLEICAKLALAPPPHYMDLLLQCTEELLMMAAASNLAKIILSMAKLKIRPTQTFAELWCRRAGGVMTSFTANELAQIAWSWGEVGLVPHRQILVTWNQRVEVCMNDPSCFDLSTLVDMTLGLVSASIVPPNSFVSSWCDRLLQFVSEDPSSCSARNLAEILTAIAQLYKLHQEQPRPSEGTIVPPEFVVTFLMQTRSIAEHASNEDRGRVLLAAAKLGTRLPRAWRIETTSLTEFSATALTLVLRAFAEMLPLSPSPQFCRAWGDALVARISDGQCDTAAASTTLYAFGRIAREGHGARGVEAASSVRKALDNCAKVCTRQWTNEETGELPAIERRYIATALWGLGALQASGVLADTENDAAGFARCMHGLVEIAKGNKEDQALFEQALTEFYPSLDRERVDALEVPSLQQN